MTATMTKGETADEACQVLFDWCELICNTSVPIVSGLILTPMLPIILQRAVNGLCIGILAFVVLGSLYCMGEELYNDIFGKKKKSGICTYYDGKKWRDTEYYE